MPKTTEGKQEKPIRGRFRPGQSGNPSGRPKGARHKATMAVEALLNGEADAITRKAIDAALAGDMTAIRLCLDRIAHLARAHRYTSPFQSYPTAAACLRLTVPR